jgi:pimeloyl-ACP methyl ester carboxylesterase
MRFTNPEELVHHRSKPQIGQMKLDFPIGYHRFHRKQLFNFPLNRWYSLGFTRREDMAEVGSRVATFSDWKREMLSLADRALDEGRLVNAAFAYRAAELYTMSRDPDKNVFYDKFIELFYKAFEDDPLARHRIPYENGYLPAIAVPASGESKGTILLHGGFDSFIEEWYSMMRYFAGQAYNVIGFEGPGQGGALRKYGLPITYEWERPTRAVLDYFSLADVTIIGMSMGGWFCLRAAAFEPRVKRIIASGHAIDYMKSMNVVLREIHLWCMGHFRAWMERMAEKKFRGQGQGAWIVDHLKYITKRNKALDALDFYLELNERNMHPERITQDVLVMTGTDDHFIPFKMHDMQIRALANARSVTGRLFTRAEHAGNHCQTGNIGLALKVMLEWLREKS